MTGSRAPSETSHPGIGRRSFLARSAAAGVATWVVPTVISTDPVAAATGSCSAIFVFEFTGGLEGWQIFNNWPQGADGLWGHNSEPGRDGGSLHYGRGTTGNYMTGGRNSGRIRSPKFAIPATGLNTVTFTVFRDVDSWSDESRDVLTLTTEGGGPAQTL